MFTRWKRWGTVFQAAKTEYAKARHGLDVWGTPSHLLELNHEGQREGDGHSWEFPARQARISSSGLEGAVHSEEELTVQLEISMLAVKSFVQFKHFQDPVNLPSKQRFLCSP